MTQGVVIEKVVKEVVNGAVVQLSIIISQEPDKRATAGVASGIVTVGFSMGEATGTFGASGMEAEGASDGLVVGCADGLG